MPAWDEKPPNTFNKYKLTKARDATNAAQRRGIRHLDAAFCKSMDDLAARCMLAGDVIGFVVFEYFRSAGGRCSGGESWWVDDLQKKDGCTSRMAASLVSCAEVRAVLCVSSSLRDDCRQPRPHERPPCCFVRCALASIIGGELDSSSSRQQLWQKLRAPDGPIEYNPPAVIKINHSLLRRKKKSTRSLAPLVNINHSLLRSFVALHAGTPRLASLLSPDKPYPLSVMEPPLPASAMDLHAGRQVLLRWIWLRAGVDGRSVAAPAWDLDANERASARADSWVSATIVDARSDNVDGWVIDAKYGTDQDLGKLRRKTVIHVPMCHVGIGPGVCMLGWPKLCAVLPTNVCARSGQRSPPPCLPHLLRYVPEALFMHPLFTKL